MNTEKKEKKLNDIYKKVMKLIDENLIGFPKKDFNDLKINLAIGIIALIIFYNYKDHDHDTLILEVVKRIKLSVLLFSNKSKEVDNAT